MSIRLDRRGSEDEAVQKSRLKNIFKNVTSSINLNLDLSYWDSVSKGNSKDAVLMKECGELVKPNETGYKRVPGRDTKTFDGLAMISNGIKNLNVYMFCKYTKNRGGQQDSIMYEVASTTNAISNNKDENCLFMFLLEGDRWENNKDLINDRGFNDKAILLPTNGNDSEISEKIKDALLNYFYNN